MKDLALSSSVSGTCLLLAGCNLISPGSSTVPILQAVVQYEKAQVSTIAGSVAGSLDGPAAEAKFASLRGLAVDASGSLYVSDLATIGTKSYHRIRKIDSTGTVSTIAGGEMGLTEGPASEARFAVPLGLAVGSDGRLFIVDSSNNRIRVLGADNLVSTFAGSPQGYVNGTANEARFMLPVDIASGTNGLLYLAEQGNVRKITSTGEVSTLAGGASGLLAAPSPGEIRLSPRGIGVDPQGNVLVADSGRAAILKITPAGEVSTLAGPTDGRNEHVDGPAAQARFNVPQDVAADQAGNVFVADGDGTVRRISPQGVVTTLAGVRGWDTPKVTEGEGSKVQFGQLSSIAVDASGSVIVTGTSRISRIRLD